MESEVIAEVVKLGSIICFGLGVIQLLIFFAGRDKIQKGKNMNMSKDTANFLMADIQKRLFATSMINMSNVLKVSQDVWIDCEYLRNHVSEMSRAGYQDLKNVIEWLELYYSNTSNIKVISYMDGVYVFNSDDLKLRSGKSLEVYVDEFMMGSFIGIGGRNIQKFKNKINEALGFEKFSQIKAKAIYKGKL